MVLPDFTQCLDEISAVVENYYIESVFVEGDFNAHPGEFFWNELVDFRSYQKSICADVEKLQSVVPSSYTFINNAHGCTRWLDHCVATGAAWHSVEKCSCKVRDVLVRSFPPQSYMQL